MFLLIRGSSDTNTYSSVINTYVEVANRVIANREYFFINPSSSNRVIYEIN